MTRILPTILLASVVILISGYASAAGLVPCGGTGEPTCTFCHFFVMIKTIIDYLLTYIIPGLAVLFLIIGGLIYILSQGSPNLVSLGKNIIMSVVIGFAIVYCSWLIVFTIANMMGVASWVGITSGGWSLNCTP